MKKRVLMTIYSGIILCSAAGFHFVKSDTVSLNAHEDVDSSTVVASSDLLEESSTTESTAASTTDSADSDNSISEETSGSTSVVKKPETTSSSKPASSKKASSSSDKAKKTVGNATPKEVEDNYSFSITKNSTTKEFIDLIKGHAQQVAWDNDLYASVMIAQAILETGSGNSSLSQEPNYNLFGIKGDYKGESIAFATQEDDGSGHLYTIKAAFRKYPGVKESLEDYAKLLKTDFYSGAWKSKTKNYHEATKFLTGRYATDTTYNRKLDALIAAYHLTDFDTKPKTKKQSPAKVKSKPAAAAKQSDASKQIAAEKAEAGKTIADIVSHFEDVKPDYHYKETKDSEAIAAKNAKDIMADEPIDK